MTDFLFQATASNLVVTTLLAAFAWFVQRHLRSAALANVLWALVLIKMVTPPLFSIPVFDLPVVMATDDGNSLWENNEPAAVKMLDVFPVEARDWRQPIAGNVVLTPVGSLEVAEEATESVAGHWPVLLITSWTAMSLLLLMVSSVRILHFHRLFCGTSRFQQSLTSGICRDIARRLQLKRTPDLFVTTANVAPFVWWRAGRAIVVVSDNALQNLTAQDLRFVLTHEMAHIKRKDHWFRWLEWLAVIGFWWNPVMWWTRTQLRVSEEIACDELVLTTTRSKVRPYANSLLNVAELLTKSAIRPPSVASAINGGGTLEKRLKTMIAGNSWQVPSTMRWCILSAAVGLLPLGLVGAQDFEAVEKRLGGAVEAGELSLEQANLLMQTLRESAEQGGEIGKRIGQKKRHDMSLTEDVKAAVDAGKLTAQEGERKIIVIRGEMFGDLEAEAGKHAGQESRHAALAERIKKAVDAGLMSGIKGGNKSIAIHMEMSTDDEGEADEKSARRLEIRKDLQLDLTEAIKDAVQAGTLSAADGKAKILGFRMKADTEKGKDQAKDQEEDQEEAEREADEHHKAVELKQILGKDIQGKEISNLILQAMKSGKLLQDDAAQKVMSIHVEALGDLKTQEHVLKAKVLEQAKKQLESAIKSGKKSKPIVDGDISIIVDGSRIATDKGKMMFHDNDDGPIAGVIEIVKDAVGGGALNNHVDNEDVEVRVEVIGAHATSDLSEEKPNQKAQANQKGPKSNAKRSAEVSREIQAAVESARNAAREIRDRRVDVQVDLSTEREVAAKLRKQEMQNRQRELEAKKRRFTEIAKEIDAAVNAGKISEQQGERKRIEIRTEMFRSTAGKAKESAKPAAIKNDKKEQAAKRAEEKEQAEKKAAEQKERLALQEAKERKLEEATRRIRIAIEKGELTEKQGDKKIAEVRDAVLGEKD